MEKKVNRGAIYGKRNVAELIHKCHEENLPAAKWGFREVFVKKQPSREIIEDILNFIPKGIKITYLNGAELDAMFKGVNHQGIILIKEDSRKSNYSGDFSGLQELVAEERGPILILDRIQDTGNLGNILRTAECFGITRIVLSERESAPVNDTVERISSGAIHHLKIFRVVNLRQVLDFLKENGYWIVATSDRGLDSWDKLPELDETAIIMGNEEAGVKRILLENADFVFQIPMHGKVSSLNVVVATGIVLDRIVNRNL
ncbi:MAG TPA: 23S rRNA (guanosine(2251)-2'-O)-methyltransferase RlmB [Leptospiraceae bacterium]|nr:23S rRNA (guanosine(2251)-2'-O)-methyltransferase RlmB [Leptospiraceae bacterium]HMW07824.1 23S rRNA (guanosine(2251)-2'-O)-methyltransferase RlmB [Leptospiraceae bacterium]HMX34620.1 23S rRNA (guanosine(2251)-2'-O)-methyltransferase RlmB [Leptospiraceae bacterium]HMY33490.1 23S rRNA (guanosine(2251)-2'-O)-methyltransferase RlmB [Leptospiraceae bacterium]HMZ65642.1 23S rRNA (guanosine(2251)-2'-O)-methyltransferase RlmB [Leptospiraceae bacterium]